MTRRSAMFCRILSLLTVTAAFAGSIGEAQAQGTPANSGYTEQRNESGAAVVFKDDLMKGGDTGPTPSIVSGGRSAARGLLIRPRYNFVAEMLKSVENI